jgi:hypothetical protein
MHLPPQCLLPALARCVRGALLIAGLGACGDPPRYPIVSGPRDWDAHPAIVALDLPTDAPVFAVSDVHGGYDRLVALLARHGVIAGVPADPASARWTAGHAVLVVAGDMIDKGPSSLEVIVLFRALQTDAAAAGGHVVAALGNHEAEFFVDPLNSKADADDGIDPELRGRHLDPMAIANGSDPRGRWLRESPFGVRVGGWFFSHAGNTGGRTLPALEAALRAAVTAHDYNDPEIVGSDSILEARDWWTASAGVVATNARALGVQHFVFGHTPSALGARGAIALDGQAALFRIDCGMSPGVGDSQGSLLRVRVDAGHEVAEALTADGQVRVLWRAL